MTQGARRSATMIFAVAATACSAVITGAGGVAARTHVASEARAAATSTWGTAIEVPGTAALNRGGTAVVNSVSCGSAGNCSAGGDYTDGSFKIQAFVVSETNGTWGTAIEVPGTAALNQGVNAGVSSVSCASAGNCSAGGGYEDGSSGLQAFVVSQRNGTWGTAIEVPGTAALNRGGTAVVGSVSCASAGNCGAGGSYAASLSHVQAFVVNQRNGTWHAAEQVPGSGALNRGGNADVFSVSCSSAGNCSAGGEYVDRSEELQAFVGGETNGTWHTAEEVPGTSALNKGGDAAVFSLSCASAGNCSAGGPYKDNSGHTQPFVVSETNGTWGTAIEVPGTAALNQGGDGLIESVSCGSAGNCSAGGHYLDGSGKYQAFVVSETNGTWGTAEEVPGIGALNRGGIADVFSVSCASAGNCSAGGLYHDGSRHGQAFVVNETNGTWGTAIEIPGTAALNKGGYAVANWVSCASASHCSAGGSYTDGSRNTQAFVVDKT